MNDYIDFYVRPGRPGYWEVWIDIYFDSCLLESDSILTFGTKGQADAAAVRLQKCHIYSGQEKH